MKITVFLMLIAFLFATNCVSQSAAKDKYIKRAKNQNEYAWMLAVSGTVLHIAATSVESSAGGILEWNATPEEKAARDRKGRTASALYIAGAIAFVGCIPLFISSHINHKRSLRVAIDMKPFNQLRSNNMYASGYPALTLKIGL